MDRNDHLRIDRLDGSSIWKYMDCFDKLDFVRPGWIIYPNAREKRKRGKIHPASHPEIHGKYIVDRYFCAHISSESSRIFWKTNCKFRQVNLRILLMTIGCDH